MPRSSFAIAMKDYTFIRPGIAVSISAGTLIAALIIGILLIAMLGQAKSSIAQAGHTVRTLHGYSAAVEVWRQMAQSTDPEFRRPEAQQLRDSIRTALTTQLQELQTSLSDSADKLLVQQVISGFGGSGTELAVDARQALIVLLSHQDEALFAAVTTSQRAILFASVLLGLTILAAGLLIVPMAWLYIRYKRGGLIQVQT